MNFTRPLGFGVIILGAVLLGFGYHFSGAPIEKISEALTGRYTDSTMWYLVGGFVLMLGGGVMTVSPKRI